MIKKISFIYRQYLLGHPVLVLFFLAIILIISATNIKNFTLDASADTLILEDDRDLKIFRNISERYKSSDFMILTLTDKNKNIFSSDTLRLIDTLSREIKTIQNIDSVTSITNIPLVTSSEKPLTELINDIPNILSEGIDRDRAKEEILTSPIYKDLIISSNAKTTAMQLVIKKNESLSNALKQRNLLFEKYKEDKSIEDQYLQAKIKYQNLANKEKQKIKLLIREIRKVQSSYSNDRYEIRLGGIPMITDDMITFIKNDLINFGFGVLLFILITLVIIFRKFIWVAAPIVNCIYAVLFMIGLLGYMDWKVTVISSNFISLMLILTLSMNIHIIVRYRQIFSSGDGDKFYSIHQTTKKMIWPCLYTALTTIVAFASLVFSDIKPVIDFGYMMVIGLTTLFITSFTLLPCFILVFSNKDNSTISNEQTKSYIVDSLSNVALKFGKHIYAIVAVISVITLYGITQLKVENSFINYFRSDTEIHKGMKLIDNQLGGTTPMDIIIKFPDSKDIEDDEEFDELLGDSEESEESNWFTTEKINKIKYVHDYLNNNEYIGKVLSLASSIRVAEIVNDDKELNSLEMSLLYKQLPVEVKDIAVNPYLSIEDNEARINIRVLDSNQNLRRADLIEKIRTDLNNDDYLKSEVITITGILLLYNNMLQSLFDSQIKSLGFVMLIIASMFLILFRSIKLMIIGIIPNLLSALLVLGIMGIINLPLDMMTITIAAITVGIAVDNSIHYIYRFKEEFENIETYEDTVKTCHSSIGRAIFFTGITVIFGFSILILSNFIPTIIFGTLTGLAMLVALVLVLTLLPRLLISMKPL
jgi:predicted RND superfamily exporter protein|tara:strand:- start:1305 stop:3758 length:2454 start_codon:yes stop_codon:yes gene_type:complete